MKQREDRYCAIINPEFLFNTDKKFKSLFAPWVYVYIRLDYIGYLNYKPQSFYKIDRKSICDFFGIPNGTVTRVFKELIGVGLLEEEGREYRLIKDELIFPYKKKEEERQYPEYVQVFNNFFIDFTVLLKERFEEFKKQPRALMKVVEVFHYLIAKNHHIITAIPKLVSKETCKSISKVLHHDEDYVKGYLGVLESIGYIEYDTDGNIITVFGYGYKEPFKETKAKQFKWEGRQSDFTNEEVEQPQVYNNAVSEYLENDYDDYLSRRNVAEGLYQSQVF